MSSVHYFPRYSQPENVITNNSLLLLVRLHQYNRYKFESFLGRICADCDIEVGNPWLQFLQQRKTENSIVDGFISQDSIKIGVETKRGPSFSSTQLLNHLSMFKNEQHKLLILLSPESMEIETLDSVFLEKAKNEEVDIIPMSFGDIIEKARACLSEHDEEMMELVADFEVFCSESKLLPNDLHTIFVPPCTRSVETNMHFRLYYCPETWSRRQARYLGVYAKKCIQGIGRIGKVVACTIDRDNATVSPLDGQRSITKDEEERILGASQKANGDITSGHKFFLFDEFEETHFCKTSPGGIQGHRYLDIRNFLKPDVPDNLKIIADRLKKCTWQ